MTIVEAVGAAGTRADGPAPGSWLGGRFRLDERVGAAGGTRVSAAGEAGTRDSAAGGLAVWKATDELLRRPVTVHLLPRGIPVPPHVVQALQAAARVSDPRLATIYDTDYRPEGPYLVSEWAPGTHLEDLVLSGLPSPALAAAMMADAADAIAVAHRSGLPHLCLNPRSLRWDAGSGLKITGLGIDAVLRGPGAGATGPGDSRAADVRALARMLYALLTGYWPGEDATALPPAPRHKGRVCTPRQVRAGVPAILDAIAYRGLSGEAPDAPLRPQTAAGLAMALRMVQRPSCQLDSPDLPVEHARQLSAQRRARHGRSRTGIRHRTVLLRPAA